MERILGNYVEPSGMQEYLIIQFSPTAFPLQQRWRNNGLSADFMAEYWTTFLPAYDVPPDRQNELKGAISYIANELLENVMKFNYQPGNYSVRLELHLDQNKFRFYASNAIDPQALEPFQAWIQRLLVEDTAEMYLKQIQHDAADETGRTSRLGLLTMLNDYGAQLAWKFEPAPPASIVTTMVEINL